MATLPGSPLVLIVDDNAESRRLYATYFSQAGFRVEEAGQGFQGIEKAFKAAPDVILMDLLMPALDGWETIRLLKGRARTRAIPIIALTGDTKENDLKLARNAGCDALLIKPCLPEIVFAEVQRLLNLAVR
jgi:two-component system, cell cycle response regulator DivK